MDFRGNLMRDRDIAVRDASAKRRIAFGPHTINVADHPQHRELSAVTRCTDRSLKDVFFAMVQYMIRRVSAILFLAVSVSIIGDTLLKYLR